ncbi:hypothetical protein [Flavisolibacter tropicus]|uniref:Uncharacterized protein n=1 Tax=Flavisolibacter tropicus TaxID=1492898 RepID=A0A172TZY5_9BACT|nr:hypothetical protein [Flavisolibacter tropicus]ANE52630.1 hypothetical protein SY85_21250 [Flavisolibacter tropicus]
MKSYFLFGFLFFTVVSNAQKRFEPEKPVATRLSEIPPTFDGLTYNLNNKGSLLLNAQNQEVQGSRYLVNGWAKGKVVLENGTVNQSAYKLNYDKINDDLILKVDDTHFVEVDMSSIESFNLIDSSEKSYSFLRIPGSKSSFLVEVYKDSICSLYKKITTKFYRADYENKGLYEKGYKYDRYVDETTFFMKNDKEGFVEIVNLNKKELRKLTEIFPKAKEYISENKVTPDKEKYLTNLTIYLNKHS